SERDFVVAVDFVPVEVHHLTAATGANAGLVGIEAQQDVNAWHGLIGLADPVRDRSSHHRTPLPLAMIVASRSACMGLPNQWPARLGRREVFGFTARSPQP